MNTLRKLSVLAGIAVIANVAVALPTSKDKDTQILIDRALNSPTLTVRYSGANATLVEFRLNGESIGTRTVSGKSSGETTFNVNLSELKDGDNDIEIRLYDRTGKLIGREKTKISTDQSKGPVYLESPKVGQTVQGPVEIKLGLGQALKNITVSYFIDSNWKSLMNNPPYTYLWDTSRETNGWHEVEAWVVDENSTTLKTKKTRVLVNNPGGRTDRNGVPATTNPDPIKNPVKTGVGDATTGSKTIVVRGAGVATVKPNDVQPTAKPVVNVDASLSGIKPTANVAGIAYEPKNMAPKPKAKKGSMDLVVRRDGVKVPTATINAVNGSLSLVPITRGSRMPKLGTFAVLYNNEYVTFDVPTRVDNGVPMTPFRHLIEKAGGKVDWEHSTKTVNATADGHTMNLQIGDKYAKLDAKSISLEIAPYIDRGRTIVPLSFIREALQVEVDYDRATGHVLITKK